MQRSEILGEGGERAAGNPLSPTSATVSASTGKIADRQIKAGDSRTLTLEFEANANTTTGNYDLTIDFGAGPVVFLP